MTLATVDCLSVQNTAKGPSALFTAALLKVASRCNLNCDYCYVYKHADQTWRNQPHFISDEILQHFGRRLDEYVNLHGLTDFCVTFHGGEPLLYGANRLVKASQLIREAVRSECALEFSLQSNATLLTNDEIDRLEAAGILVSLSIDGPQHANDRHRLDHSGRSTFEATFAAIERLRARKSTIFRGVIAVIDPDVRPRELFEFFSPLALPRVDFLLPDATHVRPPLGRDANNDLYVSWLTEAFGLWFQEFSAIPIRWFDAILASRLGIPSPTDAMGMGSVSLIVIDTDGSYTDHDVFKILPAGGPSLDRSVATAGFDEIADHPVIREHGYRLTLQGLAEECQRCPVVDACGGGSVMHRWHPERKLVAPTVYCRELFTLFEQATGLLRFAMQTTEEQKTEKNTFPLRGKPLVAACMQWRQETEKRADDCARKMGIHRNGTSAAALILRLNNQGGKTGDFRLEGDSTTKWLGTIRIQSIDPWLIHPFADSIRVLPQSVFLEKTIPLLAKAKEMLAYLDPSLPDAFAALISDIIFVESTAESRDQIFSFSDDSAPNVIYVSPFVSGHFLEPDDFTDSLLHEFLHQILYHLERHGPMLLDHVFPHFPAPWCTGLRPAGGFFHGTFVFAGLSLFWRRMTGLNLADGRIQKCQENAARFQEQANYGIQSLRQFGLTTKRGAAFLDRLAEDMALSDEPMRAPGVLS